eukprot:737791_1
MATLTAILTMFSRIAFGAKYVFHDVLTHNDGNEESAAVGSQQTGMQGMQSVATWNVNTIDNVQSNTEGNDSCDDVADGDGLHMVTAGAVAGHTHIVEAPKKESENALVCTDCGLKK